LWSTWVSHCTCRESLGFQRICKSFGKWPAYVAFGDKKDLRKVEGIWKDYGKVIRTELVPEPGEDVSIPEYLFIGDKKT